MAAAAVRVEGQVMTGTIKVWNLDKGFGFITCEDGGSDVFAHQSALKVDGDRFRAVMSLTKVQFMYYMRDGKETAKEIQAPGGTPLPGFASKLEAATKIASGPTVTPKEGHLTGTIKFMNKEKGFGFIIPDVEGEEMFVHVGDIDGQQVLGQGEPVSYTIAVKKGDRAQAVEVTPLRPQPVQPAYPGYPPQQGGYAPQGYAPQGYPPAAPQGYYPPPAAAPAYGGYGEYGAPVAAGGGSKSGAIKWYNESKAFGFVVPNSGGPDVYFKGADIVGGGALTEGEAVTYETKSAPDGKVWATEVARTRSGGKRKAPQEQGQEQMKRAVAPAYGQGGYGAPPPAQGGYGAPPAQQYGAPPSPQYGAAPSGSQYGGAPPAAYGAPPAQQYGGYAPQPGQQQQYAQQPANGQYDRQPPQQQYY